MTADESNLSSNEQLYVCECAEVYGSHHPECPAQRQLDRQRAEVEQLRTLLRIARDEWYDDNGQWGDGFGLKHWTRKADALLSGDSSFHEPEKRHE